MAARNYKVLPPFDEKKSYESWKNEVEIWGLVTDFEEKKQVLAVYRWRDEQGIVHFMNDEGMNILLTKLDAVFLKDKKDRQYEVYTEFDRITRENGVSMIDYMVEFECRYDRILKFKMELPDAVLAFKRLDTAGLNVTDKQLPLTACPNLSFVNRKSALKRIFGDNSPQEL